jgi:hypothetical protein
LGEAGSVRIGFLRGDVNQNRTVTLSDMLLVNAALTQPVSTSTFLLDVNANGAISLSDKVVVNANLTHMLPPP